MKKLLSLIGSVSIVSLSSSFVVACGSDSVSTQPKNVLTAPNDIQVIHVGEKMDADVFVGGYEESIELAVISSDDSVLKVLEIVQTDELSYVSDGSTVKVPAKKLRLKLEAFKVGNVSIKLSYGNAPSVDFKLKVIATESEVEVPEVVKISLDTLNLTLRAGQSKEESDAAVLNAIKTLENVNSAVSPTDFEIDYESDSALSSDNPQVLVEGKKVNIKAANVSKYLSDQKEITINPSL
ncbi:lipoprotein [Spiroplasma taiwanense]|uniref:Lipoprotein n=1 Tax=Spiroplasma taiwanense CT-1 TaxID=1276220 RepID=S5LXY7_9MOLU|nr:lipoprotein [Spiroplasma taiwanense]AGR41466.1 hypothetical protein STAIW_v1c08800 [Spiroplasma taiwanense CT-1]